jgi:hypothetical protein
VLVDARHHLRAEHQVGELWPHRDDQRANDRGDHEQSGAEDDVGHHAPQQARVAVRHEPQHAARGDPVAGIDEVVRAADEAIEVELQRARGAVRADGGKVGGRLAVEQPKVAQVGAVERADAVALGLRGERVQPIPVTLA